MSPSVAELLRSATALHSITLQQPWGTAVAELGKDVENRVWAPPQRALGQPLAIHAGLVYDERSAQSIREGLGLQVPGRHTCPRGAVVAVALLAGVEEDSASQWAVPGQRHWLLQGTVRLPQPVPCKGAQGLWQLPAEVFEQVRAQVLAGVQAESPAAGPELRASHRAWSKGSARGAGPAQQQAVLYVRASKVAQCPRCGGLFFGTPGEPHAPRIHGPAEGWPNCEHEAPFLVDCSGNPVAPPCCRTAEAEGARHE